MLPKQNSSENQKKYLSLFHHQYVRWWLADSLWRLCRRQICRWRACTIQCARCFIYSGSTPVLKSRQFPWYYFCYDLCWLQIARCQCQGKLTLTSNHAHQMLRNTECLPNKMKEPRFVSTQFWCIRAIGRQVSSHLFSPLYWFCTRYVTFTLP